MLLILNFHNDNIFLASDCNNPVFVEVDIAIDSSTSLENIWTLLY